MPNLATSPVEAKRVLARWREVGNPQPAPLPRSLPLSEIGTCEAVFQHRNILPALSAAHTQELARVAARRIALAPIVVWWTGHGWVCIDGHHRLAAYALAKWTRRVPVKVFEGDTEQATVAALEGNSKAVLPMQGYERTLAAWRLVNLCPCMSKREQVLASGAGEGTVASMRRVRRVLRERDTERDTSALSWTDARREEKHGAVGTVSRAAYDGRDYEEEAREKLRPGFAKAFGQLPLPRHMKPVIAQIILELAPDLADWMALEGGYRLPDDDAKEDS